MRVEKSWGYEQVLWNGTYCLKLLVYTRPIASSMHYHERKTETFWVSSGRFELEYGGGDPEEMLPGHHVQLMPRTVHRIRCVEPGIIVEGSDRDDPDDCVRLVPSES